MNRTAKSEVLRNRAILSERLERGYDSATIEVWKSHRSERTSSNMTAAVDVGTNL